jgi:hypothetical protein
MNVKFIKFHDFLDSPYLHGWNHIKKAFTSKPRVIPTPCFCKQEVNPSSSILARASHLGCGVLLLTPIINVITHIALKILLAVNLKNPKERVIERPPHLH